MASAVRAARVRAQSGRSHSESRCLLLAMASMCAFPEPCALTQSNVSPKLAACHELLNGAVGVTSR